MGLKRYLIERDIPGIGGMSVVELCGAARASNGAIAQLGGGHAEIAGAGLELEHVQRGSC